MRLIRFKGENSTCDSVTTRKGSSTSEIGKLRATLERPGILTNEWRRECTRLNSTTITSQF